MIGGVAPWFGGKRTLASDIVEEIGSRSAYWEPFCGSCAVLLALPPSGAETVNDLHGHLTHCLRVLADRECAEELYDRLYRVVPSEGLWKDSRVTVANSELDANARSPELAAAWMTVSWLSMNGMGGRRSWASTFGVNYAQPSDSVPNRWRKVVASIPAWHERLRNVCVLQRDAIEMLSRIRDEKGTVIYCDPPYITEGHRYTHALSMEQFGELASQLRRFEKARVLLSFYENDRLVQWYPGWTVRQLSLTKTMGLSEKKDYKRTSAKSPEVLLINGPSYVEAPSLWPL